MNKREELIVKYVEQLEGAGVKVDHDLLTKVTVGLGPSIYNADAAVVASSDSDELETVKKNYLIKKLGLKDGPELDKAIGEVVEKLGASNRNKYRALFYALLAIKFKKESVYN